MLQIIINTIGCIALTEELSRELAAIGEDVSALNKMTWRAGASHFSEGVFLVHSDDADTLRAGGLVTPVTVKMLDDTLPGTQGQIIADHMFQIAHRPLHIRSKTSTNDTPYPGLYAVRLVDERYFWPGVLTTGSFDVTTTADRSAYYTSTKNGGSPYTWTAAINALLALLGTSAAFTLDETSAGNPTDYLQNSDPVPYVLDRMCAALGVILVANLNTSGGGSRYSIVTPNSLNANALLHNDRFLANRIAGGVTYSGTGANAAAWLNAIMPSSVTVNFPRQRPASTADAASSSTATPLVQIYSATSTAGKPTPATGTITGRSGYTASINDAMWAIGPIGTETNATALQARADFLSAAYYARWRTGIHDVRLMGWCNFGLIAGEIQWSLTPYGPFTDLHTRADWSIYGGDRDVVDGFNKKNIVGLGGIQTHKTFDGSLVISNDNPTQTISGLITGNAAGNGKYTGKSFTDVTADVSASGNLAEADFGTLAAANDCLVLNPVELGVSNTGHDVTAATNTAQFAIYFTGRLVRVNSDGTKVVHAMLFYVGC